MDRWADYYRLREKSERAAAETAGSPEARAAHLELAQRYAELSHSGLSPIQVSVPSAQSRLTISHGTRGGPQGR